MNTTTDVGEAAKRAVEGSRSFVSKQLDERSTQIGRQVSTTADDLRRVGEQLRESGTIGSAATLADTGADYIERLGAYLENSDGDALIADLEDFARRRPWAVASAALVAGFAASRLLKASSARRYRASSTAYPAGTGATARRSLDTYAGGGYAARGTGSTAAYGRGTDDDDLEIGTAPYAP